MRSQQLAALYESLGAIILRQRQIRECEIQVHLADLVRIDASRDACIARMTSLQADGDERLAQYNVRKAENALRLMQSNIQLAVAHTVAKVTLDENTQMS